MSGTSSIHGYRTVHEGNLRRQLEETLDNLAALLAPRGLSLRERGSGTLLTVYLRHAEDLAVAEPLLAARVAPEIKRLFLQGDICRRSLLVEIEGIMEHAVSAV
ncbi:MAG: hypothetical protein FJ189_09205 [Gammaproteobacteria bacterium]|nr:hypothetical protein [Gammaproteobacteria bacterium]